MESTTNAPIFPKFVGINDKIGLGGIAMLSATIIQLLIQIPLFRPLYRLAGKDRYALLIVFYKACCTLPISLQTILGTILVTDPQLNSYNAWFCVAISTKLSLKLLVLLFTFCRFWAIMYPWGYERIWKKKRINFYSILTILLSLAIGYSATIQKKGGFLDIYAYISQFSILLAIAFYAVSIIRLIVQKCTLLEITMENDRIKIMIICLASLMPMLIDQLPFYLLATGRIVVNPNLKAIILPSWFPLLQINGIMMMGFDEYVLIFICTEFRSLVKKELMTIFGKFLCKKFRNANARQLNHQQNAISTNSWMRGLDENENQH